MLWLFTLLVFASESMLIDFGNEKNRSWNTLNDTVMGGRSSSIVTYREDVLTFKGSVSFQNKGGFASLRSPFTLVNLSDYKEVEVRYRCEGQSLNLTLRHHEQWYLPNYKAVLPTTGMVWKTVTYDLASFREYQIGKATGNNINAKVLQRIIGFSIMTNDKKEGPFQAEIDYILFK